MRGFDNEQDPEMARQRITAYLRPFIPAFKNAKEMVLWATTIPAWTVLVLIRHDLGFRFCSPLGIFTRAGFFILLSAWSSIFSVINYGPRESHSPILIYGLLLATLGIYNRRKKWNEIKRGELYYSYSRGQSWLEKLFPNMRADYVQRFLDPLAIFICVPILWTFSSILAVWFFIAGAFLFIAEQIVSDIMLNNYIDIIDNMVNAEIHRETTDFLRTGKRPQRAGKKGPTKDQVEDIERVNAEAHGLQVSTAAEELQRTIERRRRREELERKAQEEAERKAKEEGGDDDAAAAAAGV